MGDSLKRFAVIAAVVVALAGCAEDPPPPGEKVQAYYDEHVVNQKAGATQSLKAAVIGDSYAAGAGAGGAQLGWVDRVARYQGWVVNNVARGGTGYTASVTGNAQSACGLDYCPSYAEMIDDAVEGNPSIILVAGGRNDAAVPREDESAAITDFYQRLRAAAPDARIIAVNAVWDDGPSPESLVEISAEVRTAVESVGGIYLDIGQPLEARPDLLASDGVHPNTDGHAALAEALIATLPASDVTD